MLDAAALRGQDGFVPEAGVLIVAEARSTYRATRWKTAPLNRFPSPQSFIPLIDGELAVGHGKRQEDEGALVDGATARGLAIEV